MSLILGFILYLSIFYFQFKHGVLKKENTFLKQLSHPFLLCKQNESVIKH